ncbi:hypothetical protein EON65_08035 [archaeon]|nr:MAG: hypothetical protein EON65_08035 [archaeon]
MPKDAHREDIDTHYFGLSPEGRVHFKSPALELTSSLSVHKSVFAQTRCLRVRKDIQDMYIYVCKPWVVEYIQRHTRLTSVYDEVLPYILQRQFMSKEYVYDHIPEVKHRDEKRRGLGGRRGVRRATPSSQHLTLPPITIQFL